MIIQNIKDQIQEEQKERLNDLKKVVLNQPEMIHLRSPLVTRRKLYAGVDNLIIKSPKIKFKENVGRYEKRDIAEQLVNVLLEELVKGGEILYINLCYHKPGDEDCWIRY